MVEPELSTFVARAKGPAQKQALKITLWQFNLRPDDMLRKQIESIQDADVDNRQLYLLMAQCIVMLVEHAEEEVVEDEIAEDDCLFRLVWNPTYGTASKRTLYLHHPSERRRRLHIFPCGYDHVCLLLSNNPTQSDQVATPARSRRFNMVLRVSVVDSNPPMLWTLNPDDTSVPGGRAVTRDTLAAYLMVRGITPTGTSNQQAMTAVLWEFNLQADDPLAQHIRTWLSARDLRSSDGAIEGAYKRRQLVKSERRYQAAGLLICLALVYLSTLHKHILKPLSVHWKPNHHLPRGGWPD
ncbi:hypothetical protein PG993_006323 [Apiospora rasikravindrae]|uniref:Uncharacterized protein n=1 Tax=Apiospora rasikravindrae TaxID=990691 RepID=A0ABR1T5D1_9PEZI